MTAAKKPTPVRLADFTAALDELPFDLVRHRHSRELYYRATDEAPWLPLDGYDEAAIHTAIEEKTGRSLPRVRYQQLRDAYLKNRKLDPFKDYINGLLADPPEYTGPDITTWHEDLWGAEGTAISRFAASATFLIPVILSRTPGARIRTVPILVGGMGCGKSTFVEHLLPPNLRNHYTPDLALDSDDDRLARSCRGKVVVCMEEMRGLRRAGWGTLKSFTSATLLQLTPKYIENEARYRRTWLLVGCSNEGLQLPADPVAAQRFLPIMLPNGRATEDPVDWLSRYRDQLFHQAASQIWDEDLTRLDVPDELAADRLAAVDRFRDDTDAQAVEHALLEQFNEEEWVSNEDLSDALPDGTTLRKIGSVLAQSGWQRKQRKVKGKVQRGWYTPMIVEEPAKMADEQPNPAKMADSEVPVPLGTGYPHTFIIRARGKKVWETAVPSGTGTSGPEQASLPDPPESCSACRRLRETYPNSKGCAKHWSEETRESVDRVMEGRES